MSLPIAGPFAPRRIVIGANAHAELAQAIRAARSDLEIRGNKFTDLSADDMAWGEA